MALENSRIQDLIDWASSHNSSLHPNIEIYLDPVTGLSFRAKGEHAPGLTVVAASNQISLSYLNAIDAPGFPRQGPEFPTEFLETLNDDDPNVISHFFLVQQYLLGDASFWWPYIRLLPQPDDQQSIGIPISWSQEDRRFLTGTNAEPPLQTRKKLWVAEWEKGITVLKEHSSNWEDYSYVLYQWAASIFGSRSFRASLTVQQSIEDPLVLEHAKKDRFSVLLPLLDIGNHNGVNNVDWITDHGALSLKIRNSIPAGAQIFNFYGNKSNSELLVAYGFTLPVDEAAGLDVNVVNLKLKASPEALALRRNQSCYQVPRIPDEECTFMVQKRSFRQDGLADMSVFSDGLIDLIICIVANTREKSYISTNPEYCPERDPSLIEGPLYRSALQALSVLYAKLLMEEKRIRETGADLPEPSNDNQRLALDYRQRQLGVLSSSSLRINKSFDAALTFSSFCPHQRHTASTTPDPGISHMHQHVELLSLECAFEWLRLNYPEISISLVKAIAEDQEEPLPLNWAVLVEDWDHTYWVVWIYTIWLLWARDGDEFRTRHEDLWSWMVRMNDAFDNALASDGEANVEILHADASEAGTIDQMVETVAGIPAMLSHAKLRKWLAYPFSIARLTSFASFVAKEETFTVGYRGHDGTGTGADVQQKVLCIGKGGQGGRKTGGTWSRFFAESLKGYEELSAS